MKHLKRYKKNTDVQQTWREYGWTPPSEDPKVVAKWHFYRTLNTDKSGEEKRDTPHH